MHVVDQPSAPIRLHRPSSGTWLHALLLLVAGQGVYGLIALLSGAWMPHGAIAFAVISVWTAVARGIGLDHDRSVRHLAIFLGAAGVLLIAAVGAFEVVA